MDDAFDNFDADAAWPSLIDGFVDWSKEHVDEDAMES